MLVIPQSANFISDFNHLHNFLLICQQRSIEEQQVKIVSVSLEIPPIDPLAVLQKVDKNQPHFFFEQRSHDRAIVMIGAAVSKQIVGADQFAQAQQFIEHCTSQLTPFGSFDRGESNPYFFCSFSFSEHPSTAESPLPSAQIYLPKWQIVCQDQRALLTTNLLIHAHSNLGIALDTIHRQLQTICAMPNRIFRPPSTIQLPIQPQPAATERFTTAVANALNYIDAGVLDKVVLAHAIDVVFPLPVAWIQALHRLRQTYPECHVFSTSSGEGQVFIGASPERLLSVRDRLLTTDALAGSAPRGVTPEADRVLVDRLLNTPKEQHEHQVVVDFITQQLIQLGLTPQWTSQPQLLQLSNIQHLHTPIQAPLPATLHPLTVLAQLHPTPAVAGMPRDRACDYIQQYESFERSLYAAPLGWIDTQGNAEFVVGIRSALITGNHARLYGGAGIVAGSDPDRELAEVQLKLQALLQALR